MPKCTGLPVHLRGDYSTDTEVMGVIASYLKMYLERKWSFFSYELKSIIRTDNTQNGQGYSKKRFLLDCP